MKSFGEIEERIRRAVALELERRLERDVLPAHCRHNHRQPLDHRRTLYGESNTGYNRISLGVVDGVALPVVQTIGLCMVGSGDPETWAGNICEDPLDAQRCPQFEHRQSVADVYRAFVSNLEDPAWVKVNLPEVGALLWVIEGGVASVAARAPWWARVWMWILRGPLREFSEVTKISVYLPAPPDDSTAPHGTRTAIGDGAAPAPL